MAFWHEIGSRAQTRRCTVTGSALDVLIYGADLQDPYVDNQLGERDW